jgi:hypothetical protein
MNWLATLNLFHLFEFYLAGMLLLGTGSASACTPPSSPWSAPCPDAGHGCRAAQEEARHLPHLAPLLPGGLRGLVSDAHPRLSPHLAYAAVTPGTVHASGCAGRRFRRRRRHVAFDVYTFAASARSTARSEKHFDQAEYWLRSWTGPLGACSFGYLDPRQIVHSEVEKALTELNGMLTTTLWWVCMQVGLRIAFGLSLWVSWAYLGAAAA